jgi:glutamate--cysteine ligase
MPSPTPTLTLRTARHLIRERAFPEETGNSVGAEIEWFTTPSSDPPNVETLRRLLGPSEPQPNGSIVTFEPGGQVELSSAPFATFAQACVALDGDTRVVRRALAGHGIGLWASGIDRDRPDQLLTDDQRYVAMKHYFDRGGVAGRTMMCTSAAIHVNVDAGADERGRRRWHLAHQLGPTLVAAFANSPLVHGRPSGWMSTRMGAWMGIDPTRTAPANGSNDPVSSWIDYALRANVMFIRDDDRFVVSSEPMSFAQWAEAGHELGYPTPDDLLYHLTTLFPPVRPRGWLELRMIDMVPDPWWRVAVAVTTALLDDDDAAAGALEATKGTGALWNEAARWAVRHPALRDSAQRCFDIAIEAVARVGGDAATVEAVHDYDQRFVSRGLCPADLQLETPVRAKASRDVAEAI